MAETLSKAKNTAVSGLVETGIVSSSRGKVRLLKPNELPEDWDPLTDKRLTHWETVHHLVRVLEAGGEGAAAEIVAKLGSKAEIARELCYRLYHCASARSARPRRWPTTLWCRAGRKSRGWREKPRPVHSSKAIWFDGNTGSQLSCRHESNHRYS